MSAEAIIKAQARDTLKNNYVGAVSALLIVLIPFYIQDGATTVISCLFSDLIPDNEILRGILIYTIGYIILTGVLFFLSPLLNGYIRAHYKASYTMSFDVNDVFFYFEKDRYGTALSMNIRFILRMLLPAALMYLPLILFDIFSSQIGESFRGSVLYNDCFFLLAVLSTTMTIIYSLRYLTACTICADIDNLTPKQAYEYSHYIMKNKTGSFGKLFLSFMPWLLLCLTALPFLYVIPYIMQSLCISAKWMTKATFEVN